MTVFFCELILLLLNQTKHTYSKSPVPQKHVNQPSITKFKLIDSQGGTCDRLHFLIHYTRDAFQLFLETVLFMHLLDHKLQ